MKIAIGADHRGYDYKEYLKKVVSGYYGKLFEWVDVGTHDDKQTDYPLYVAPVIALFESHIIDRAILLCGSGIGMAMAANRHTGMYAGVAWNVRVVRIARQEDNINILVIPTDFVVQKVAVELIIEWLKTPFSGGHYAKRLEMIDKKNIY